MSKLSLDPEALVVQSFSTTPAEGPRRGTVRGMENTVDQDTCHTCAGVTCNGCTVDMDTCVTCAATCPASCATCPLSCYPAQCPSADGRC